LKELIDSARRIVISPEFLVVALALWVMYEEPQWLTGVSNALSAAPDGVKYLAVVPVAVAAWCIQQSRAILFPPEDSKGLLQEWPKFKKLKERVLIGLAYQVVFCTLGIGAWVVSPNLSNGTSIIVMAMAIVGSLFGAITFFLAGIMASEITKRYATKI